jgi:hypothetical protein
MWCAKYLQGRSGAARSWTSMPSYVATGFAWPRLDENRTARPQDSKTLLETIMRFLKRSGALALTLAAVLMSSGTWADNASPVGLWKNVDDVSGKPRALIRVTESNGTLQGKIEKYSPLRPKTGTRNVKNARARSGMYQ